MLKVKNWASNLSTQLISRSPVSFELQEVQNKFSAKNVLVTGAGGSIASEICSILVKYGVSKIVLFDVSEVAIYLIESKLKTILGSENVDIVSVLGSVTDPRIIEEVISTNKIEVLVHAAAYKHVPIVENNIIEGLRNNILGTDVISNAAIKCNVERVVLVSTDKAVRPPNIMGATKRVAELIIQGAQRRSQKTVFSSVRFGNVLESSGSVIPLFKNQIDRGGPVTVLKRCNAIFHDC